MPDLRPRPSPEPRPVSLRGATSDQSAPLPQRKRLLIAFWTGLILGMTGAIWAEGTLFSVCVQPAYLIGILCLPLGVVVPQNPFMLGLLAGLFWFVVTYLVVTVWAQRQQRRRQRLSAPVPALSAPAMPRTQRLLIASRITFLLVVIGAIWGGETAGIGPMASIGAVIVMPGFLFGGFVLLLFGWGVASAPAAMFWLAIPVFWFGLIYLLVTAWDQGRRQLKR